MAPFIPYIAISVDHPRLELPKHFRPDDIDILVNATPEERAVVVNTGCVALRALKDKKDQLSEGEAFKQGKQNGMAAEKIKWQQEKTTIASNHEANVKDLKEKLLALQAEMDRQKAANVTAETRRVKAEADATTLRALELETINRTRAEVESEMSQKLKTLTDELNAKKAEAVKAANDLWKAQQTFLREMENKSSTFRDEEKKLRDQLNKELKKKNADYDARLNDIKLAKENEIERQKEMIESISSQLVSANARRAEELKSAQAANEMALLELFNAKQKAAEDVNQVKEDKFKEIREAEEKVRAEFNSKIDELQNQLRVLTHRQANSSIKGKDNEDAFSQLLDHSFGSDQHYSKLPKTAESGDHVIKWKGLQLMFENKKYTNAVPKTQVDKALRDFMLDKNKDCDVLIFVSEDTNIINRDCPFDITRSDDGRPAIWISKFGHNEDKVVYLQLVGQVAEELVRLQRREKKFENGQEIVDFKKKVEDLIQSFNETKVDLDNLLKLQNACQRRQNKIWKDLKEETVSVIARFKLRQANANGNEEEDDGENGADADSEPKVKKPRKTPMKNRTPQHAKNTMLNYVNKSPLQVLASGHQQPQQQEGSKGLSAEVGDNKAKLKLFSDELVSID
jgi:O6-methylguanine-DNA--protein-cysteine methyltransferase